MYPKDCRACFCPANVLSMKDPYGLSTCIYTFSCQPVPLLTNLCRQICATICGERITAGENRVGLNIFPMFVVGLQFENLTETGAWESI